MTQGPGDQATAPCREGQATACAPPPYSSSREHLLCAGPGVRTEDTILPLLALVRLWALCPASCTVQCVWAEAPVSAQGHWGGAAVSPSASLTLEASGLEQSLVLNRYL